MWGGIGRSGERGGCSWDGLHKIRINKTKKGTGESSKKIVQKLTRHLSLINIFKFLSYLLCRETISVVDDYSEQGLFSLRKIFPKFALFLFFRSCLPSVKYAARKHT